MDMRRGFSSDQLLPFRRYMHHFVWWCTCSVRPEHVAFPVYLHSKTCLPTENISHQQTRPSRFPKTTPARRFAQYRSFSVAVHVKYIHMSSLP